MKTNLLEKTSGRILVSKPFLIMRLILIFIVCSVLQSFAHATYSHITSLTLNMRNVSVEEVLNEIEEQSEFHFLYSKKIVNVDRKVDIAAVDEQVSEILNKLFKNQDIAYLITDRQIVLNKREELRSPQQEKVITGLVKDHTGEPVIGANVMVPGESIGVITDYNGEFILSVPPGTNAIEIRYIGYITERVNIRDRDRVTVHLREDLQQLDDVVVIGYGIQKKANLTGAVDAVKGEKLDSRTMASTSQSLQGMIPGMTVYNEGG